MNGKKGILYRLPVLLMSAALLFGCVESAAASEGSKDLDLNQKGSIFISLVDDGGTAMMNGTLALYQVAELGLDDGNMIYTYTGVFADFGEEITQEVLDAPAWLAQELAEWAKDKEAAPLMEEEIQNGSVTFSDLPLGLYLIIQTEQADGFYLIDPFLVTLPFMENGVWVYGVDASPKAEINPEAEPEPQSEPDTESEPYTESESETEPGTETESESETGPGTETESESDTESGSETEAETETESESETEKDTGTEASSEEQTDTEEEGNPPTSGTPNTETPSEGSSGGTGNYEETEKASETLPQTGQLNWPIPFLAGGGLILFIIGTVLVLIDRRKKNHAA